MRDHYARLNMKLRHGKVMAQILDHSQAAIMVVDQHRRLAFASQAALDLVGATDVGNVLGQAPGDVFRCINAKEAGCGHSQNCCDCGAFIAIREGMNDQITDTECYLSMEANAKLAAKDFLIHGAPLQCEDGVYVVLSLQDVGHEKRRRALEQIFFHDIINTVGAVKGLLHFLHDELTGEHKDLLYSVLPHFDLCVDEIVAQRKLLDAENNELVLTMERFSVVALVQSLAALLRHSALGTGKEIVVQMDVNQEVMLGDRVVMHRICLNLLKNALEATAAGGTVRVDVVEQSDGFVIHVANLGVIPAEVQHRIFHRSFSTKGSGRGLGTYSTHLLCTNYLHGRVWFESSPEKGTVFSVFVPQQQKNTELPPSSAV